MAYKDPDKQREFARKWLAQRRSEYLSDKRCVKCGSTTDLEIDHIDPSTKVSHRVWSWSAERRAIELAKCQVLCRKCHDEKTAVDQGHPGGHGSRSSYLKGCRCALCHEREAARVKAWRERVDYAHTRPDRKHASGQ